MNDGGSIYVASNDSFLEGTSDTRCPADMLRPVTFSPHLPPESLTQR